MNPETDVFLGNSFIHPSKREMKKNVIEQRSRLQSHHRNHISSIFHQVIHCFLCIRSLLVLDSFTKSIGTKKNNCIDNTNFSRV